MPNLPCVARVPFLFRRPPMPVADVRPMPSWRPLLRAVGTCAVFCCAAATLPASAVASEVAAADATNAASALTGAWEDARVKDTRAGRAAKSAKAARTRRARRARRATSKARAARTTSRTAARGAAMLRGSRAAVDHAYSAAKRDGLVFARSRREIERGANAGDYVRLNQSTASYRLRGVSMPYVRPATQAFVARFGADYRRSCGEPLTVTSAMRPTSMHLANSVEKTVHPTGMAVDLRVPQRARCRTWMRNALIGLERRGVVNATEERRPAHFHVVVYREP